MLPGLSVEDDESIDEEGELGSVGSREARESGESGELSNPEQREV